MEYINDLNGQVSARKDMKTTGAGVYGQEYWYRFGGKQLAYVGNNNTITTDYVTSVNNRTTAQGTGAYMNGSGSMTLVTDTDQGYDPLNSYDSGQTEGAYTIQAGDTLQSIAAQLWGDSSLWYKLAEVNGLSGDEALTEGALLTIPPGVVRSTYTASTFTPYDPNDVIGNTAPTAVKPPKSGHGCGIAQVLLVVIAIAVAVVTAGAAVAAFAPASAGITTLGAGIGTVLTGGMVGAVGTPMALAIGAVSGAAGSIVSQGIGVMSGIQDKFSWSAVGLAAIAGAIGGGGGKLGVGGSDWTAAAARGAISSALTQGIGVATGLQDHFSWAGVAGAAVGAAVGFGFGKAAQLGSVASTSLQGLILGAATNSAGAIANAATRSLLDGSDFDDNVLAAIPDAIGQTIGNAIAGGISRAGRSDSDYASVLKDRFAYDEDTQLPLNQVPGAYQEAGTSQAPHRSFWDWVLDVTGLGDGLFGDDDARPGSLHFDLSNLGAAIHNLGRQSEDIVVTGHRVARDADRIIREAPVSFAHGITDSVHHNITQPIVAASNGIVHIARDPGGYGVQTLRGVPGALDNAFDALDRFNPDALINSRLAHYSAAVRADGAPGFANALSYDAGYATPLLAPMAAGPYGAGAEYGLTTEDAMLFSLRPRLTQLEINSANGAAFQARVNAFGSATLDNFVGEVSIRPNTAVGPADFRIRIDGLGTTADSGVIELLEAKGSATAPLTPNQPNGFPLLQRYGGTIVGANGGPVYPAGTPIPQGTAVRIIRPDDLPPGY